MDNVKSWPDMRMQKGKGKKKTIVEKGAKGFHQLRIVFLIIITITIITIIITITIIVIISFGTNNGSSRFSITSNRAIIILFETLG